MGDKQTITLWRPLDHGGCPVDPENHKGWLPLLPIVAPHIGITILREVHVFSDHQRMQAWRESYWLTAPLVTRRSEFGAQSIPVTLWPC